MFPMRYLGKFSGLFRQQVTRLVAQWRASGRITDRRGPPSAPFPEAARATGGGRSIDGRCQPLAGVSRLAMAAHRACRPRIRCVSQAALLGAVCLVWGCGTPPLREAPSPIADVPVSAATWAQLGIDIRTLAADAQHAAFRYAQAALERWFERVQARTESEFIPWATDYWTHQWLALKLAWYRADGSADEQAGMARLTDYLCDAYRSKVLEPVARETDPLQIMDQASGLYASTLAAGIQELWERYGLPRHQFGAWLERFPAISTPPGASLRDLVETEAVTTLAAYQALTAQIRRPGEGIGATGGQAALRSAAERTAERLATTLAVRGGAAAASVLGGVPGALLGLGISAWDAATYEHERPALEAVLRSDLDVAVRRAQWSLLSDRAHGVLAPVANITEQISAAFPTPKLPSANESAAPEELF
jgi:hypothetical protein